VIGTTARVAYLESLTEGFVIDNPSVVSSVMLTFDTLRSETLAAWDFTRRNPEEG
jgi:hypothetical protein